MTEALLFVGIGSVFAVGVAALGVAVLALRQARRYVDLAEERMERLNESQALLLLALREGVQESHDEPGHERERQKPRQARAGGSQESRARREADRIDELKRGLLGLREADQQDPPPVAGGPPKDVRTRKGPHGGPHGGPPPSPPAPSRARRVSGPMSSFETAPARADGPRVAASYPHPDDDVKIGDGTPGVAPGAATGLFRTFYDRYLDNYEGYVKLVERLHRARDEGDVPPGSPAGREWEERLRRAENSIDRTTERLDILEQYNPELAPDDRVRRRAAIARAHAGLAQPARGGDPAR